jgi:hypothetical protein
MRETRSSGSVEGVMSNRDPYSDRFLMELGLYLGTIGYHTLLDVAARKRLHPQA